MIYTVDEIKTKVIPIAMEYGVNSMSLFGSYARGDATEDSDIDFLIDRGEIKGLIDNIDFIHDLKMVLGCDVDVVTTGSHNKSLLENIRRYNVKIYEKPR